MITKQLSTVWTGFMVGPAWVYQIVSERSTRWKVCYWNWMPTLETVSPNHSALIHSHLMTGIMSQIQSMLINIIFTLARLHSPVSSTSDSKSWGHKLESQLIHLTFMEIDHEIFPPVILPFLIDNSLLWNMKYFVQSFSPTAESRRAVVSFGWKNVHNNG